MKRTTSSPAAPSLALRELPMPGGDDQVVFVTNAVRRRGGLRTRAEQHRPVLAAVVS